MSNPSEPVLELRNVTCNADGHALRGVSLRFHAGRFHVVTGEPVCLRAALLRVFGLLDAPESGEVFLDHCDVAALAEPERDAVRNQRCGFLFAAPFLLPSFTVVENVAMPLFKISHFTPEQARERTDMLLEFVGLAAEAQQPVDELTGFQQHAVSLARALANAPAVITVESLDAGLSPAESASFTALLRQCCVRFGVAVIASVPAGFPVESADRIIAIDCGQAVAEPIAEGKPLA